MSSDTDTMTETQDDADVMDDWAAALSEQAETEGETAPTDASSTDTDMVVAGSDMAPADFDNLVDEGRPSKGDVNMDVILDVPVTISMEIGRTKISIRNLLQLNQGSVVELDRLAGEPMDVLVNGTLIAHGEVVVVNEKFGIRLTDVISPAERIKKLK
jgi:flagellar motor switch protein FliN/FliY